jgi:hypothetical protein
MTENTRLQRLFGGCGCESEWLIPLIILGVVLLFGDEFVDFIDCNEELTLIFIIILLMLLFL